MSRWIFLNWDIFTDWLDWAPDHRAHATPDDVC